MATRRGVASVLASCAAIGVLAAPAPSGAWEAPVMIADGASPFDFAFDANERGDRIVVWKAGREFRFAQARPGEPFGAAGTLPATDAKRESGPRVELDERGNALLAWTYFDETDPIETDIRDSTCCDGLRARVIRRDGTFTSAKTMAPAGNAVGLLELQLDRSGRFGIVFSVNPDFGARRFVDARFGTVRRGFDARERVVNSAAAGPFALSFRSGRARVAYATGATARTTVRELERVRPRRYRRLASPLRTDMARDSLRFATAPNGRQAAVWQHERRGKVFGEQNVYAATRAPGRPFEVNRLASERFFAYPSLAVESAGNTLLTWRSQRRDGHVGTVARPRRDFGALTRFGPPQSDGRLFGAENAIDVNVRGHGVLTWAEYAPGGGIRLSAALRNVRGVLIDEQVVATPADSSLFVWGAGLDRAGRATVAVLVNRTVQIVEGRIGG